MAAATAAASCSQAAAPTALDPAKVATVAVGRSTRADVFTALGKPGHTERSGLGEAWVYEAKQGSSDNAGLVSGVSAASGLIGAFVPFAGLAGSGLGLANTAVGATRADPQSASLTVTFRDDGVVRDCLYSSTAAPAGVPGQAASIAKPVDCQRPAPGALP